MMLMANCWFHEYARIAMIPMGLAPTVLGLQAGMYSRKRDHPEQNAHYHGKCRPFSPNRLNDRPTISMGWLRCLSSTARLEEKKKKSVINSGRAPPIKI